jgi:hypothetical protein
LKLGGEARFRPIVDVFQNEHTDLNLGKRLQNILFDNKLHFFNAKAQRRKDAKTQSELG